VNDVAIGAIGAVLGTLFAAVSGFLIRAWEVKHKQRQESQQQEDDKHDKTVGEYRQILTELRAEVARANAEADRAIEQRDTMAHRLGQCYQQRSRMEERIVSYEDKLAAHNVPFRPWVPLGGDDSAPEMEALP